jgi:anti-sigma factor RsiW
MLTDDEVRDLFSAYHDRELSPDRSDAVRAALDADAALKREYDAFVRMLAGLSAMAAAGEAPLPGVSPPPAHDLPKPVDAPDLLGGVQRRLQQRSGGKFYADGWSRLAGVLPLELLATLVLIALVVAYAAMTMVSTRPAPAPASAAPSAAPR